MMILLHECEEVGNVLLFVYCLYDLANIQLNATRRKRDFFDRRNRQADKVQKAVRPTEYYRNAISLVVFCVFVFEYYTHTFCAGWQSYCTTIS
jgi:hypothetical protein